MADVPLRTYSNPTGDVLNAIMQLGGSKESQTSTTSAAPAAINGLTDLFNTQLAGTTPQGAAALLQAIFQQGLEQVPGLATTYAQAAGARVDSNSALQLAMQDMMGKLAREGALQLRQNQEAASQTGSRLAENTRTVNQSAVKKPRLSPLQLAPFALANADKLKKLGGPLMDKLGLGDFMGSNPVNLGTSTGADLGNFFDMGPSPSDAADLGSITGADLGSFFDFGGSDAISSAGSAVSDLGSSFSDAAPVFGDVDTSLFDDVASFFEFNKGGLVSKKYPPGMKAKGYADGGFVEPIRHADTTQNVRGPNGEELRGVTYNDNMDAVRGIANAIVGASALTGPAGASLLPGQSSGGSSVNRKVRRFDNSELPLDQETAGTTGIDAGIASGPVGSGIGAGGIGAIGSVAASAIGGIPGLALGIGLNALGFPGITSQVAHALVSALSGGGSGVGGTEAQGHESAIGIGGVNSGGLAGMGVTMGLGPDDAPDSLSSQGLGGLDSGGVDGGVGSSSTGGTDGVGDAAAAGAEGGGFAAGGQVSGPAGKDVIPAYLTDGEFVLNNRSVRTIGVPMLKLMNERPEMFQQMMSAMFGGGAANQKGRDLG
jgi:hypothetical protein